MSYIWLFGTLINYHLHIEYQLYTLLLFSHWVAKLCLTLPPYGLYRTPGSSVLSCLQEFAQIHVHILCYPLLLVLSTFPSIRVFSNELALLIRWPKYWSFSSSPSRELSRLISFRIDWFDLLAVQELSRVFSNTTTQKHQFFGTQFSLWFNSHLCTWPWEKLLLWIYGPLSATWCVCFLIHCLGLL